MINTRTSGLMSMNALIVVLLLPTWFLLHTFIAVEVFDKIKYNQINYPIYLIGMVIAGIVSSNVKRNFPLYGSKRYQWIEAIQRTNTDIAIMALILFSIIFATKDKAISRIFLSVHMSLTWLLLLFFNRFLPTWLSSVVFSGENTVNTILLGSAEVAKRLEIWYKLQESVGVKIVGLVNYEGSTDVNLSIPIIGDVNNLQQIIKERSIHQIILLETRHSKSWVTFIQDTCQREGCRLYIYNHWEEYFERQLTAVNEGEHTFFTLQDEPLQNPVKRALKRLLDIIVSLPIVLIILIPLCLLVKYYQNKQAPGPLFFRQIRSGQQKSHFTILKFRTMHTQDINKNQTKQASINDERIYKFGSFLRKTSLDEFPQFLNVIRGNMSVVGPRPHMIQHDEEFSKQVDIYRTRTFVKPGITGLAQVNGFRGEITDVELIQERIRYDLEYINNWTIWFDIGIIIKTFWQVFFPQGNAY